MKFLELVDFEATQHYKDRTPPWIKLHRTLLTKREFLMLNEQERYHYVCFQILASECANKIPIDEKWLKQRFGITSAPAWKPIVKAGLARVTNGNNGGPGASVKNMSLSNPSECFAVACEHHNRYSNEGIGSGWIYGTPDLPDEITAAVRLIGGWDRIANLRKKPNDIPFAQREFIAAMKGGTK